MDKEKTSLQIRLQNCKHENEMGKVSLLIYKEELEAIELGEIDGSKFCEEENLGIERCDAVGIAIQWDGGSYVAGCWNEELEGIIAEGKFNVYLTTEETEEEYLMIESKEDMVYKSEAEECEFTHAHGDERICYEKIGLTEIRNLPCPNWHLSTNSFLLHGFWNYGYLVLKKTMEENEESFSLGVPGVFEKPEALMALYFGFSDFEEITDKKENQEPKVGDFGCWFIKLKK